MIIEPYFTTRKRSRLREFIQTKQSVSGHCYSRGWPKFHGLLQARLEQAARTYGFLRSLNLTGAPIHGLIDYRRAAEEAPDLPTPKLSRVAVDGTTVKTDPEQHRLYAAIDVKTKLLLEVRL